MKKYRKFCYDVGYVGTEVEEYYEFDEFVSDKEINKFYLDWLLEQFEHSCVEVEKGDIPEDTDVFEY